MPVRSMLLIGMEKHRNTAWRDRHMKKGTEYEKTQAVCIELKERAENKEEKDEFKQSREE